MRELHGWHERGDHGRHARGAPADGHAARVHDGPRHAADNSLKLRMLLDPEARKAARLDYQKKVEAVEAEYAARHAKPKPNDRGGDQGRAPERPRPQEPKPEHAAPETRDKPATGIAKRRLEESVQAPDVAAGEKPRLTAKAVTFWSAASGWTITTAGDYLRFIPPHLAGEISGAIGVIALGILWRQADRTENRDGNRHKG